MPNFYAKHPWILVILISLTQISAAATGDLPVGALDFSHANPALEVSRDTPAHTRIALNDPLVAVLDTSVDFTSYKVFAIPGEPFLFEDGAPTIPMISRLYRIPNTGSVDLSVLHSGYTTLDGVDALPYQPEERGFGLPPARNAAIYGKDAWYPAEPVVVSEPMIFRDFRVVRVSLYPVQVNPVTRQARVYHDLTADLIANDTPGANEINVVRRPSRVYAEMYRNLISNLDETVLDDVTPTPGSYLIICRDSITVRRYADSLAIWKRRAGYTVAIEYRTNWTPAEIANVVDDYYTNADPPLEFVCLFGDHNGQFAVPTSSGDYDHGYACPAGGDDIEDIGIGRLPVSSGEQCRLVYRKILTYERDPYMDDPSWFRRGFLYAGTGYQISSNEIVMYWARQQFYHFTGLTTINIATHNGSVNNTTIGQQLDAGVSYFLWRGTVVGEMDVSAASAANNGPRLPVALTITCGTGDFADAVTDPAISESWILAGTPNNLKGGICGIGTATLGTHVQFNNTVAGGLVYAICNLGVEHLGPALGSAKAQLVSAFPTDSYSSNFIRWNNLMGDPGLSMWTDQPVVMAVTCPGTVNVGSRRIRPQVLNQANNAPIEGALVVLWKGTECYTQALTDANGFADVPVTIDTPGILTITVTKRNHKPFLADISCVNAPQMVSVLTLSMDDDNAGGTSGNSNARMNPGEIIDLNMTLKNYGTSDPAETISAVLTSDNAHVSIVNGTALCPSLAPGSASACSTPFRISVSPVMQRGESAILTLAVTADGEVTHSSTRILCEAAEATYVSVVTDDNGGNNNSYIDPGETGTIRVNIRNTGDISLNDANGVLYSGSSYVSVSDPTGSFGTIAPGATGSNGGTEFTISVNSLAYRGHPAPMILVLTTYNGFVDSVRFSIPLGLIQNTDPTGPDPYGYYAYENVDVGYEMSRPFQYINISSSLGTSLYISDPGEQPSNAPTYSVLRDLPFQFRFYGQTYSQITICSNGWAAFGDQDDQDHFRNYPIPGEQAPDAMIAPFWDDLRTQGSGGVGVWVYSDADSHRYVIQWKAGAGSSYNTFEDFEIILLDPAHYPTRDGNGIVIVQYQTVQDVSGGSNDIAYATVGIEAPGCTMGLLCRFGNMAEPGCSALTAGRSIVFTTESRSAFGAMSGVITDSETGNPLPGVAVSVVGQAARDTSDAQGAYFIPGILFGTYTVRATKAGYNDAVTASVVVSEQDTTELNFAMLHPEIALSTQQISVTVPDQSPEAAFEINNAGNGPLDYTIRAVYSPTTQLDDAWNYLAGFNVSGATGGARIWGCEVVGDYWWVTGGLGTEAHHMIYRFTLDGTYVDAIPQPSDSALGWMDMAYDGNFVYGSNGHTIVGVDAAGAVRTTIPSPVNPTRAIAYNPAADNFWVADYYSGIYEITRDGTVLNHFPVSEPVTGLAWNPSADDGYKLFIAGRDSLHHHFKVSKMHPVSGHQQYIVTLDRQILDYSGGCTITSNWNNTLLVFAGILQNPAGDKLGIWELDFNTTWITINPMIGTVIPGSSRDVEIQFNPAGLRPSTYRVNLVIANNSADDTLLLPVTLVNNLAADEPLPVVTEYRLHQNYPNPFNGMTTIRYDLRKAGPVSLRIFNLLGQEVAALVSEPQDAGTHIINCNLNRLSSGVYLYRLETAGFSETKKLMLLR